MTNSSTPHPAGGAVEAVRERNKQVLILLARMEAARTGGKTFRLNWRELDVLWTVFRLVMDPAATWAYGPIDPEANPHPDFTALLAEIAEAMTAEDHAARALIDPHAPEPQP